MKNTENNFIFDNPYMAMIFLIMYGFAMTIFADIISAIAKKAGVGEDPAKIIQDCGIIVTGIILLVIHKFWFRPYFKGNLKTDFIKNKSIMICIIAFIAVNCILSGIRYFWRGFNVPSVALVLDALCAGISEEIICRGLAISAMMRTLKEKKCFLPALILPAVLFGIMHFVLLNHGMTVINVIETVVSALIAGFLFGALYLRSGSVLPSIALHFLHDFLAMMSNDNNSPDNAYKIFGNIGYFVFLLTMILLTVILIKGHKDDIIDVWNERWSGQKAE